MVVAAAVDCDWTVSGSAFSVSAEVSTASVSGVSTAVVVGADRLCADVVSTDVVSADVASADVVSSAVASSACSDASGVVLAAAAGALVVVGVVDRVAVLVVGAALVGVVVC